MPAVVVAMLVPLAGCLGGDDPEPEAGWTMPERPDAMSYEADPALAASGRWLAPFDGEVPAVNMIVLHDGRVLYFSGNEGNPDHDPQQIPYLAEPMNPGESRLLDLSGDAPTVSTPGRPEGAGGDLFCSGHTVLPDGRVIVGGGTQFHGGPNPDTMYILDGLQDTRIFDPAIDNWTEGSDMLLARWYPSLIKSADGDAIAASGIESLTDFQEHWRSWESYDASNDTWAGVDGTDQLLPLYPRVFLVPGGPLKGQYFYSGAGALWTPFGEHPEQYQWSWQYTFDADAGQWRQLGMATYGARDYAPTVMLPLHPSNDYTPTMMTVGGALYQSTIAVDFVDRIDLSTDPPTNSPAASLATARWFPQAMVLPDGKVLALGGTDHGNVVTVGAPTNAVLTAELYDPAQDAWTELPAMAVDRGYHSTAALLPDGRVLVGGHVPLAQEPTNPAVPQVRETRLEIYEPGYLFRGERPTLWGVPGHVGYGQEFDVLVDHEGPIESMVLVSPASVTHAWDSNQRVIHLEVSGVDDLNVTLSAPPDATVAPPGWYMLFANGAHEDGAVPSVARWVHIA